MSTKNTFWSRYLTDVRIRENGTLLSWRSIFAGVVTFIALSLLFSLVGTTIGFGTLNLTSSDPMAGVTTGLIIWTIIAFILSLGAAGFVAGFTANRAGFIHGFLTWAVGLIAVVILATSALASTFGVIGQAFGIVGDTVGSVASTTGEVVSNLSSEAFDAISDNLSFDTSNLDVEAEIQEALENTNIEQLQPDYLKTQVDNTVTDVQEAARRIVINGEDAETVLNEVATNVEERIQAISSEIDEETLKEEIANNTDLTEAEVEQAAENITQAYNEVRSQVEDLLDQAEVQLNELKQTANEVIETSIEVADDATNEVAKYSFLLFLGLVVAAVIASLAGLAGSKAANTSLSA